MVTFAIVFEECWVQQDFSEERWFFNLEVLIFTELLPHLALSPHWGCGRSLCYVGKLNKNQTKPSMLSVGSMSQLIIPQKMPVLVRNAWFHFPAEMKEGTGTPLPLETEAPGNLALAGCTFAYLSGHLIINLKKLLTDSLNTPDIQLELPSLLAPSLSPFI